MKSTKQKISYYIDTNGWLSFIRLSIYPFILFLWNPIRLAITLWNSRVFASGKWENYISFSVLMSINNLFYWTQAENLSRYGRNGLSPHVGTGNYHLGRWWHLSLPSIYAYRYAGAVLPLASMFSWLSIHCLWMVEGGVSVGWFFTVMYLTVVSTTFFSASFVFLNYNAIGWIFFPLGLWASLNEFYFISALAWFAASFGSITVVFIAAVLSLVMSVQAQSLAPAIAIIPSFLKILSHFFPLFSSDVSLREGIGNIAKAIGLRTSNAKYIRKYKDSISLHEIFYITIYSQFGLFFYLTGHQLPSLWIAGIIIYIINRKVSRFADERSIYLMMFTLSTQMVLVTNSWACLFSYWAVVSPLPFLVEDSQKDRPADLQPPLKPFNISPSLSTVQRFLAPVKSGERVFFAFSDPEKVYEDIFSGYRFLLEIPLFICSRRQVHLIPDWYAVFQLNYDGAPEVWGREPVTALGNMVAWGADYIIVYQDSNTELSNEWAEYGFVVLSEMDWADYLESLEYNTPWNGPTPRWWLLKKR